MRGYERLWSGCSGLFLKVCEDSITMGVPCREVTREWVGLLSRVWEGWYLGKFFRDPLEQKGVCVCVGGGG